MLVTQRQQAQRLTLPSLRRQANNLVRWLGSDLAQIQTITGVGASTGLGVLAGLAELGTLNRRHAAALAGLAPHPRESGQWQGRRIIGCGRARVRRALYMAAPVAAHTNAHFKVFYQRLRMAGKPAKVALTALLHKLIVLMNHGLKNPNFVLANETPLLSILEDGSSKPTYIR